MVHVQKSNDNLQEAPRAMGRAPSVENARRLLRCGLSASTSNDWLAVLPPRDDDVVQSCGRPSHGGAPSECGARAVAAACTAAQRYTPRARAAAARKPTGQGARYGVVPRAAAARAGAKLGGSTKGKQLYRLREALLCFATTDHHAALSAFWQGVARPVGARHQRGGHMSPSLSGTRRRRAHCGLRRRRRSRQRRRRS